MSEEFRLNDLALVLNLIGIEDKEKEKASMPYLKAIDGKFDFLQRIITMAGRWKLTLIVNGHTGVPMDLIVYGEDVDLHVVAERPGGGHPITKWTPEDVKDFKDKLSKIKDASEVKKMWEEMKLGDINTSCGVDFV